MRLQLPATSIPDNASSQKRLVRAETTVPSLSKSANESLFPSTAARDQAPGGVRAEIQKNRAYPLLAGSHGFRELDLRAVPDAAANDPDTRSSQCGTTRYRNCIRSGSGADCGKPSGKLLDKRPVHPRAASSNLAPAAARRGQIGAPIPQKPRGFRPEPR